MEHSLQWIDDNADDLARAAEAWEPAPEVLASIRAATDLYRTGLFDPDIDHSPALAATVEAGLTAAEATRALHVGRTMAERLTPDQRTRAMTAWDW